MAWVYNVFTREFKLNNEYRFSARYAGAPGYKDDPKFECLKNKGPLPRGRYRIKGVPFRHPVAGPYTLQLEPDINNVMCGRSGFLIHGDNSQGTASKGCIVLLLDYRKKIWGSGDRELIVV